MTSPSFEQACLPQQSALYGVAMRIVRNSDDAKDLVQDTLLRAMVAWDSFEPNSNLKAWLFRIMTNAFINQYRKQLHRQNFAAEYPGEVLRTLYGRDSDRVCFGSPADDQLCDEVVAALEQLSPKYRYIIESVDLHGRTYKSMSEELGVPIGTVMSRLFRARRVLRAALAEFAAADYGLGARAA